MLARDVYSLTHFPLIGGIIGFAAAVEEIVAHPADVAPPAVVAALGVGIILFVGSSALAYRRLTAAAPGGPRRGVRLVVIALAGVGALTPLPAWLFAAVAVVLAGLIVIEERSLPLPA